MKHESKQCPRCGKEFECKVGDVQNCQCNFPLQNETSVFLAKTKYGCLCAGCLAFFDKLVSKASKHRFPVQKEMLQEGLHYYKEGSKWVFTEFYHILKGYCCENSCRHCPYNPSSTQIKK